MRICHVLSMESPGRAQPRAISDAGILACRQAIEASPEHEHTVLLFGPGGFERRALALGIDTTDRIACPSNDPAHAETALERYLTDRPLFDVLTCYAQRTLALWQRAGWLSLDAVGVMLGLPREVRHLEGTPIIALDERDARAWQDAGGEVSLAEPKPMPTHGGDRVRWRARLGAQDDELVVALLSDPGSAGDAAWFCYLLMVLEYRGVRTIGLLSHDASGWTRAAMIHRNMRLRSPLVRIESPIVNAMPFCDACVTHADDCAGSRGALRLLLSHAADLGVPVVGGPLLGELLDMPEIAREALVAPDTRQTALTEPLARLAGSKMLRRRLRTILREGCTPRDPSLGETLRSVWAHAPARRRSVSMSC